MASDAAAETVLRYDECQACGARWRPARDFCPRCGAREPKRRDSSGRGIVAAVSRVDRPPSRDIAPGYVICLVDLAEGLRVMGHATEEAKIGAAVVARYVRFAGALMPLFEPKT